MGTPRKNRPTERLPSLRNALFTTVSAWRRGQRGYPDGTGWVAEEEQFRGEVIKSWGIIIMMMAIMMISPHTKYL